MNYDTSAPLQIYKTFFNDYKTRIHSMVDYLNLNFNFNRLPDSVDYNDFWSEIVNPLNFRSIDFTDRVSSLISITQGISNAIGNRYLDYVGMIQSMDQFLCYAVDAFSRITDCYYAFGDGNMYETRTGKILADGTYEILRPSLRYYLEQISSILNDMDNYISTEPGAKAVAKDYGMSMSKVSDTNYLQWKKDNYFIPQVQKISTLIDDAYKEFENLINLATLVNTAIVTWLPETFKLISYTSLAFNLNKKTESLANKIITLNTGVTTTSIIAVNQAKFWRSQINADMTNRGECLTQAILAGCDALTYPGQLSTFIDISWNDYMVPKYGS